MILLTLSLIAVLIFAVLAIFVLGIGGSAFILLFGDVIVFIVVIVAIVKAIFKKKK